MTRLLFLAPYSKTPTGGIRAIYNISRELNESLLNAAVYQFGARNFSDGSVARTNSTSKILSSDHIVLPECMLGRLNDKFTADGNFSVFVQNPYIIFGSKRYSSKKIIDTLNRATNIFVISKDAEKIIRSLRLKAIIIRLKWSLDLDLYEIASKIDLKNKKDLITFMPRKCKNQISLLKILLQGMGYGKYLSEIRGLSYSELINRLLCSKIFISLSEFEGFAAPPVEAAVLGNVVVGYHGNGNRELFEKNNFIFVEFGNIQDLAIKVADSFETYQQIFFENDRLELLSKFQANSVIEFNLNAIKQGVYHESGITEKWINMPNSSFGIFLDRVINKITDYDF